MERYLLLIIKLQEEVRWVTAGMLSHMKIRGHGSLVCGNHFCYACRDREPRFLKHIKKP